MLSPRRHAEPLRPGLDPFFRGGEGKTLIRRLLPALRFREEPERDAEEGGVSEDALHRHDLDP